MMLCKEKRLNVHFQKENLSIFDSTGKEHPFLTIFIAILGTVAAMERERISASVCNRGKHSISPREAR